MFYFQALMPGVCSQMPHDKTTTLGEVKTMTSSYFDQFNLLELYHSGLELIACFYLLKLFNHLLWENH